DSTLAETLRSHNIADNVSVVNADILEFDPALCFETPYTVVANLPYHITSPALRHLLATGPPFAARLIVMVQAEVAGRIASGPGDMSSLAIAIQAQATVRIVRRVPAAAFFPKPKVDSAVVLLEPLSDADRPIARPALAEFVSFVDRKSVV